MELPVRHGEGKFFTTADILGSLVENHQIAVQYALPDGQPAQGAFPANPNGSIMDIAGICDPTGRVFGLMPHPEGFNHWTNHPEWTRSRELAKRGMAKVPEGVAPGIRIFKNAVDYFR
jgi:phosphoribosylformylglycinamidine synthase